MEWSEVQCRIKAGEGRTVEFKAGFDTGKIGPAVCAFANTDGGTVIFGVADSGEILGIARDPDAVHERLTDFLSDAFNFPVTARCGRHRTPEGWVHWIHVLRQRNPEPMQYRDVAWVRRERSSVRPSPSELQELNNFFGFVMTEDQVVRSAEIEDLDEEFFRRYLRKQGFGARRVREPEIVSDYRNFRVVRDVEGRPYPTLFGLLAFGREPQRFPNMPALLVRNTAYETDRRGPRVALATDATGRLDEQVNQTVNWARTFGRREFHGEVRRRDLQVIPVEALREAVVNAVVHRSYAITGSPILVDVFPSRVEITSPGTLPNGMTLDMVRRGGITRTRNETIAHYASSAGLMEHRGMGWLAIEDAMHDFNGTEPQIEEDRETAWVRVTLDLRPANTA